ncbi:helix-turn-helix domain-containing protein [Streptomyces sp. NPDC087659]|uniref:helix-turn-helix domain-containing protein n=1 Tax=Streptomyces sp. NPDC087659 TaxID=3365801 RepID=UPI003808F0D5
MTEKTPGLRSLALALRRLREAAGMEPEEVIAKGPVSKSTLRRAENAEARPNRSTLLHLLTLYRADDATRAEINALWEEAGNQDWLRPYHSDLRRDYKAWIACETAAAKIKSYESLFVPGLTQTRDYAHWLIQGVWPSATPTDLEHHVQARMDRQAVITRAKPATLTAVMDEAALRRVVGSPLVMAEQMRQLQTLAGQPHVTLQVIPFSAGAHPGMPGSLAVATFAKPAEQPVVYSDGMTGDVLLDSEQDVEHYTEIFAATQAKALNPTDSLALIASAEHEFTRELETA